MYIVAKHYIFGFIGVRMKYTDQLNRTIILKKPAERIVSLVPSQTELLFDLGLDNEVIAITNFCVHPRDKFLAKKKIGGTKNPDLEEIKALRPDLIIANKEENNKEDIQHLQKFFPVWTSDVNSLNDALNMMQSIGKMVGKESIANSIKNKVEQSFNSLKNTKIYSAIYLVWNKPYMAAGNDTFISYLLNSAGFKNALPTNRYPEITEEEIKKIAPDVLLLSSEPYPFNKKHKNEIQDLLPSTKVIIVDGELFSWYGSRLQYSAPYFVKLYNSISKII